MYRGMLQLVEIMWISTEERKMAVWACDAK
jgi:hypothetical protein